MKIFEYFFQNSRRNIKNKQRVAVRSKNSKKEKNKQKVESDNVTNLVDCSVSTEILSGTAVNEMGNFDRGLFRDYIDAGVADMLKNLNEPEHLDPDCENSDVENFMNETTSENSQKNEEDHNNTCSKCKKINIQ